MAQAERDVPCEDCGEHHDGYGECVIEIPIDLDWAEQRARQATVDTSSWTAGAGESRD